MSSQRRIHVPTRRLSRRQFLTFGGGAAAALAIGACAPAATPTTAPATAAPATAVPATEAKAAIKANLTKVATGYDNPNWSHHAADIVAREKGWFKEAGIDNVDDIIFDDSLVAIIGKGVNWTAADTDAILMAHVNEGVDVWWLGTRRDKEDMLFGLAPGVTVESLKGSGASVSGGLVGSRNELLGKMMVGELGLDPEKDVTWITMSGGSDTRLAALINGNLSGSNIQVRHIKELEAAGGTVAYNKRRKIAQEGYVVMGDFLKANGDTVTAYLYAIIKAKQFLKDLNNKDEVIAIMTKNGFEFPQEFIDTYQDGIEILSADAGFEVPEMEVLWKELSTVGEAPADFDWRKGLNLEHLWKAQEALGLPRRPASL
jgi:ABC-type nitrate/sulfonate/bicarbonate transport system substrate-binding protein